MRWMIIVGLTLAWVAEGAQIEVEKNVQVSAARPEIPHREVVIAADPNHFGRLIACSMLNGSDHAVNTAAYISFDNGQNWSAPVLAAEEFADDPTCGYEPDGTVIFIAKTETIYPRYSTSDSDALFIRRSRDGGKTWDPGIRGILANDRPFMAIDQTHGPYRGRMYVAFNEHIHGENSSHRPGDKAHPHTTDDFRNTVRLATYGENGSRLLNVYDRMLMDQGGKQTGSPIVGSAVVLSDGSMVALEAHSQETKPVVSTTGKLHMDKCWLQVLVSADGGETLEPARKIADIQPTYNLPGSRGVIGAMAADAKDRLYVVWADVASGRGEILFSSSADKGISWSAPKRINDDVNLLGGGRNDFMPAIATNHEGVVGVQWYDRRDVPDGRGYYTRFTASLNSGETWLPSVRVSEAPNAFPKKLEPGEFYEAGGDTAGLDADSHGAFHALWIDNRTGVQQVWTAVIRVHK